PRTPWHTIAVTGGPRLRPGTARQHEETPHRTRRLKWWRVRDSNARPLECDDTNHPTKPHENSGLECDHLAGFPAHLAESARLGFLVGGQLVGGRDRR